MNANLPNELFTTTNIVSVGVASSAITVVTSAFYKLFKLPQKWTAFVTALLIAFIAAYISSNHQWYDWVLAFFNACLLFCSALGINETLAGSSTTSTRGFAKTNRLVNSWL